MRLPIYAWLVPFLLPFTCAYSHALEIGQTLISRTLTGETVETAELLIEIATDPDNFREAYQVKLLSLETGRSKIHRFFQQGGRTPTFVELNAGHICGASVVLLTLRYDIPHSADILQRLHETHAFRRDTLEHVDTASASYENIAPLEDGVDLGYPYTMPQSYGIRCLDSSSQRLFRFYERHQ